MRKGHAHPAVSGPRGWRFDATRGPSGAAALLRAAGELGVDPQLCLLDTGLDETSLASTDTEITSEQELRLIGNLIGALDDPEGIGLGVASGFRLRSCDVWGVAVGACSTIREATETATELMGLTCALSDVTFRHGPGEVAIQFDDWDLEEPVRRFVVERDTRAALEILRDALGSRLVPARVELRIPEPGDGEAFLDAFGTPPVYEATRTLLGFPRALLDVPLPAADPLTAVHFRAQGRDLLARRHARRGTAGRVRDELLTERFRPPDQVEIAARLHLSVRTLRRRLVAEGTSFRTIVDETREFRAERLLADGFPVEQVAKRLGFSDPSSFVHAFVRWKGVTPGRWAKDHGDQ